MPPSTPPLAVLPWQQPVIATGVKLKALALVLIALGLIRIVGSLDGAAMRNDFSHYYIAGKIVLSGGDPYQVHLEKPCRQLGFEYDPRIPIAAHPPLLIRMFACIAWLPPQQAYLVWVCGQFVCLAVLLWAVHRVLELSGGMGGLWWPLVALVVNSTSLQAQFFYSQVQLPVAALLAVAYLMRVEKRDLLACALVALAAGFKLYPAVLLPWFVLSDAGGLRPWLKRSGIVLLVLSAVLSVTGIHAWESFLRHGMPVLKANMEAGSYTNYSLQAFLSLWVHRLLDGALPQASGAIARAAATGGAALIILGAYFCIWRLRLTRQAAFSLLTIAMIAGSLVAWSHYMVLLILPAALLIQSGSRLGDRCRAIHYVLAMLCLMPQLDCLLLPPSSAGWRLVLHFYPLYTLGALAILLVGGRHFSRGVEEYPAGI